MEILELSKANFDEKVSNNSKVTVVDFWAPWCGYCVRMMPLFDVVADALKDDVDFFKVNTDDNMEIAQQFQIDILPTFAVFKNGELVGRIVGYQNVSALQEFIKGYLR